MRILLYGLGKIAITNDGISSISILSHKKAIEVAGDFYNLRIDIYIFDKDVRKIHEVVGMFPKLIPVNSISDYPKNFFDLSIIAVPIDCLYQEFNKIFLLGISKKFLIEKPGCSKTQELSEMQKIDQIDNIVRIGFQRRSLPSTKYLADLFELSRKQSFQNYDFVIEYGGTFKNIASHFFDLIEFWIPEIILEKVTDFSVSDKYIFENSTSKVTISAKQIEKINQENNSITCTGTMNFLYKNSGRFIEFHDTFGKPILLLNLESEINQMIGFEALDYVRWVSEDVNSVLTSVNSQMLGNILEIGDQL